MPTLARETALTILAQNSHIQGDPAKPEYRGGGTDGLHQDAGWDQVKGTPEPQDHNNVTPPWSSLSTNTPAVACLVSTMSPTQEKIRSLKVIAMAISSRRLA